MIYIIQLCYLITIGVGISAITVHMTARGKNLSVNNRLVKSQNTTLFLLLVTIFNVCDFLVLFLGEWLGESAVSWVLVVENILEVALAYALIEMEREYFGVKESRSRFIFFVFAAAVILWVDTAYTVGILPISDSCYLLLMVTLNLMPVGALAFFTLHNFRKIVDIRRSVVMERYFILYNLVFLFLCVMTTLSIADSRTKTDFVGNDKAWYVGFWLVFNVMNFVLLWSSCQRLDGAHGQEEGESAEDRMQRIGVQAGLSSRELEIAKLICRGKNNGDIAEELYLSINTVKVHTSNLYRKLGVRNRVQAIQVLRGETMDSTE